jgi:hypothetical protein
MIFQGQSHTPSKICPRRIFKAAFEFCTATNADQMETAAAAGQPATSRHHKKMIHS